jgi:hypothetical protein
MCVVEKAGFKPRTLGTGAERATNCATALVLNNKYNKCPGFLLDAIEGAGPLKGSKWSFNQKINSDLQFRVSAIFANDKHWYLDHKQVNQSEFNKKRSVCCL